MPFVAFAGDAIVTEPGSSVVSDLFRIFNNVVNTRMGTGLGNMAFLYSADDSALPDPSTYSANAVFLPENPSGATVTWETEPITCWALPSRRHGDRSV